ncbi:DUF6233 domain-containing protein [Streptomyces erythrochromogenes]|uniref:DUF6233 domain-containing protein n=1 Tax=Streptomyces erythrochromogenes TaxID=285574 RepID=UPI00369D23A5
MPGAAASGCPSRQGSGRARATHWSGRWSRGGKPEKKKSCRRRRSGRPRCGPGGSPGRGPGRGPEKANSAAWLAPYKRLDALRTVLLPGYLSSAEGDSASGRPNCPGPAESVLHVSDCAEASVGAPVLKLEQALDAAESPRVRTCTLCRAATELDPLLRGFGHEDD